MAGEKESEPLPQPLQRLLSERDLSFREFVEWALYDECDGYYADASRHRHRDFITAPAISPLFAWTIARWFRGNLPRDAAIVDVGCGDGGLLSSLAVELNDPAVPLVGIDRSLAFVSAEWRAGGRISFAAEIEAIPSDRPVLVICNELYDAVPFARVVMREEGLREICVTSAGGTLDWCERAAAPELTEYLVRHDVTLSIGQFADFTPEWSRLHAAIASRVGQGAILTFDYGYEAYKLFDDRVRRYGTAAAYAGHRVHRDLLARPGKQDLTCHVNFDDLVDAGEEAGFETTAFKRLARFLLEAGAPEHPIFARPVGGDLETALAEREERENARRLLLPDGIGDEMRVLVQKKG